MLKDDSKFYLFALLALLIIVGGLLYSKHMSTERMKKVKTEQVCKDKLFGKVCTTRVMPESE